MDKPYDSLDHHFNLPHIRAIGTERPMQWLRMGWNDMRENLGASLSYGVIIAAIGYTILSYAADKPYLFMAAISGFMLVGPSALRACTRFRTVTKKARRFHSPGRSAVSRKMPTALPSSAPSSRSRSSRGSASRPSCSPSSTAVKSAT